MTYLPLELAKLKAQIFGGIQANGSELQRQNALISAKEVYAWCTDHIGQVEETPSVEAQNVRTTAKAVRS
jgi:hypothetical protein